MKQKLLTLVLSLFAVVSAWAHDFEVNGIYYVITSSTDLTVSVSYRGSFYNQFSDVYSGAVVIPESVTYNGKTYSVTSIGNLAFDGCSGLKRVTIPSSVTSIGYRAFSYCSGLTSITIPENSKLTSIGYSAFTSCSGLKRVTIPSSVTSIGYHAFSSCSGLTYNVYDNALYLGNAENPYLCLVKAKNSSITSCSINSNANVICGEAFDGCRGLTSINIPNSVTSIGDYAFNGCTGLKSITIPESVTSIGRLVFNGCSGLTYNVYDNALYLGNAENPYLCLVKAKNSSITSCSINSNANVICGYAFSSCSGLTSITIPENSKLTSIGYCAFDGCSGLTSINIPENSKLESIGDYAFQYCRGLTSINIPESVASISDYAFHGCSGLTSITIPENSKLTSIGNYAFYGCRGLTSITIPESVTSIGNYAFYGCSGLTSITIPENSKLTSIGNYAFYGCSGLASITIPSSVTSIGDVAFSSCSGLTSIVVDPNNEYYDSRNNCNAIIEKASNKLIAGCKNTIIPSSVTSIGSGAFRDCSGLTSITIPESVTSIGYGAFEGCSGLPSINIPENSKLTSIGNWAFRDCSGLTSITIPSSVTSIGNYAFNGCSGLTSINIPESVTSIGSSAFRDCSGLTSITIPSSVTSIGDYAFSGCSNLKQVVTDNANVSMIKSALGTGITYIVPCPLYDQYVAAGLTTTKHHDLVKTEVVAVTCTTDGNIEYYTCNDCSKHFSDAEALTEIAENSWVIAAHHTNIVTDNAVAATCTEAGLTEGSHCEACHATIVAQTTTDAIGHLFINYIYNNDATTEEDGTETAECDHGCGMKDTHAAEGTKLIPTGVGQVSGDSQRVIKTIEGGRVVIIRDGVKYDIMGRKLIEN